MTLTNRRTFLGGVGAIAATSGLAMPALAQAKPKLVVVGGGPGGATLARYVAKDSAGAIEVTLVEPLEQFVTCFHSNLYLGGFRTFEVDHAFVRRAGVEARREARAPDGGRHRPRQEDRAARRRHAAVLRPARGGARHRHQVRLGARLFGSGRRRDAACLEARPADPVAQAPARRARGRRDHRHGRAAQSVPLPARAVRARLDDGARAQGQGPQEVAHHRARPEGELLQAGRCSRKAGRSIIPAWSSGRIRRCTAASRASIPRP